KKGRRRTFPEKRERAAAKPPRASEPVSPMKTLARPTLNTRYAASAPARQKESTSSPPPCPSSDNSTPKKRKKTAETEPASPSSPSVRLTQLTVARKTKIPSGTMPQERSIICFVKGRYTLVAPAYRQ